MTNKNIVSSVGSPNPKLQHNVVSEPDFIKLYIEHMFYFKEFYINDDDVKGCTKSAMMVLFAILGQISYANSDQPFGGMTIDMTKGMKEFIATKTNVKPNTIDKYLKIFTTADILRRVERGKYQANPKLFGKGEWKDVKNIAVTYNYSSGNIKPIVE